MTHMSLWNPRKKNDYTFFDNTISEMFAMGATSVYLHKYLGATGGDGSDPTLPQNDGLDPTFIQDILFLENRDRKYDKHIYELLGVHNVQDLEFTLSQFAVYLEADTIFMTFHINDSIRRLGRKLMAGDVMELPHLRDDALLGENMPAINKYYVITEITRPAEGFSPTWFPHLYRVKAKPITASDEYEDILEQPILDGNGDPIENGDGDGDISLEDIISDYNNNIKISDELEAAAKEKVDRRNFETQQFYVVPGDEFTSQLPSVFSADGIPPNGAELVGSGSVFPNFPQEGDYYLRTDFTPHVLYKRVGPVWRRLEADMRPVWVSAHRLLEKFINNDCEVEIDGKIVKSKQAISKVAMYKKPNES